MASPMTIQLPGRPLGVRIAPVDRPAEADVDTVADVPGDQPRRDDRLEAALEAHRRELAAQQSELAKTRTALEAGLEQISALREEMIREAETQLLDLALDVARKVLMQEIQAGRYEIDPIVKAALQRVPPRQDVVAHLHPEDWRVSQMAQGADPGSAAGSIRFVADPSIPRGECVLETIEGIVVSAVDDHLDTIADALKEGE
jgi:flagellar assembly protein FliH